MQLCIQGHHIFRFFRIKMTWLHTHFHYWPNTQILLAKNFDCFNQKSKKPKKNFRDNHSRIRKFIKLKTILIFSKFIIAIIERLWKLCPENQLMNVWKINQSFSLDKKCQPVVQTNIHWFFVQIMNEEKNMVGMSVNCMQLVVCVRLAICAKRTNYSTILHFIRCNSVQLIWHRRSECSMFCAMDQWTAASGSTVFNGIM